MPPHPRLLRAATLALAALLLAVAAVWYVRDPERETLDAEARAGAPGGFVASSVGTTHYELTGPDSARTAVLVHGFSVPSYIWDSTYHALADSGFRVLRYDLVGRGWSDRPDLPYDVATFDAQLVELLDSLGIAGPVDLFGLSYGGLIAESFTAARPARVRTLVLVDPVTRGATLPRRFTLPVIGPYLWQVLAVPAMPAGQPGDFVRPERFPDWEARYRPQMRYHGFGRALLRSRRTLATVDFPALHAQVARTGVPVLLVWGTEDATVPIALAEDLRGPIPALRFVPIDSAGHLPHLERAPAVNAALFAFLREHP